MSKQDKVYVVYDDECPLCRNYGRLIRIRDTAGTLELINARAPSALIDEITAKGLDLDHGMVVKINNNFFHGANALHSLSLLSTRSGLFNRCAYWIFKSKKGTAIFYPLLRACRNMLLRIMGVPMIKNLEKSCSKP